MSRLLAAFLHRLVYPPPVVSIVPRSGPIAPRAGFGRTTLAVEMIVPALAGAFCTRRLAEVALMINWPGGSATQPDLIAERVH